MVVSSAWRRFVLVALAAAALTGGKVHADATGSAEPIEAVWRIQQVEFEYRSFDTIYTCGGLRQKLRLIFKALGAHEQIHLNAAACDDFGRARFVITFASPIVATPANVLALTSYSAEQLLIARTRGLRLPTAEELQRFPAQWKTVSFARDRTMRLDPGDCELIRQLRREVLPTLAVEIVNDDLRCGPSNISHPRLTVSALVAVDPVR